MSFLIRIHLSPCRPNILSDLSRKICSARQNAARYIDIDPLTAIEQAEEVIQFMNDLSSKLHAHRWGIYEKSTGQLIGTCGFNSWVKNHGWRSEIGYDLAKSIGAEG